LATPSNNPVAQGTDSPAPAAVNAQMPATRSVRRCDFRLAGRLPNEDARAITALHETVATRLAAALEADFGTAFDVKFDALNQLSAKEHAAEIPPLSYIVPFASRMVMVEIDLNLVFPMIELLLGGAGKGENADRDLSEIEEGIMQDVASLIVRQAESVWSIAGPALQPSSRIRPATVLQLLRPSEKVTVLRFACRSANASGAFSLALSTALLDLLVKKLKVDREQEKTRMFSFPAPPLRERILDCDMEVCAELSELKVSVRDLVSLQPGSVLKLRAPIQTPTMLKLGDRALFEAVPVRSGPQRAAQLGRRSRSDDWKRR